METVDVFWVDSKSYLGQKMNVSSLSDATKSENMLPLTPQEISQHEKGLFIVGGQWQSNTIDGYVACKKIVRTGPAALIGGLYVAPQYRGKGLASEMVRRMTTITFEAYPYLTMCLANCNAASASVFGRLGFQAIGLRDDGKMRYGIQKDVWLASQHINNDL